jgi:hypothetical protein
MRVRGRFSIRANERSRSVCAGDDWPNRGLHAKMPALRVDASAGARREISSEAFRMKLSE